MTAGLSRLLSQPIEARTWYWSEEVTKMKGYLAVTEKQLQLNRALRDGTTGGHMYLNGLQLLRRQAEAMRENRPQKSPN